MNNDKLGFYLVGWKKFHNKILALMEHKKTGYEIFWIFNDKIFENINWSLPIEEDLFSIYKRRAQQLRDNYNYLILYYSGGADSAAILHTFIHNNIFLDEVVMQFPQPVEKKFNDVDTSFGNFYSEIKYSAIPYLKKLESKINSKTKIRYEDLSNRVDILTDDYWTDSIQLNTNFTISGVLRQLVNEQSNYNLRLGSTNKKIANIYGIDKPLVYFDGTDYYCFFRDVDAYHFCVQPHSNYFTEFFYWTPDMPELVVKQAQEVKKNCQQDAWARYMASQILSKNLKEFRPILHPIIYPKDLEIGLQVETNNALSIIRPMDQWFWQTTDKKIQNNFLHGINKFQPLIDTKHAVNGNIAYGVAAHKSKFYKL